MGRQARHQVIVMRAYIQNQTPKGHRGGDVGAHNFPIIGEGTGGPGMSDDLVKRYRLEGQEWRAVQIDGDDMDYSSETEWVRATDHAAALLAKDAEIARLRDALRPFAQEHAWGPNDRFEIVIAGQYGSITGSDLDRARAALKNRDG